MSTVKNAQSYVKEVIARMKGDTDTALAERNYRVLTAGINQQLALRESIKLELEEKIIDAKDKLAEAKYPTSKITDVSYQLTKIANATDSLNEVEADLEDVQDECKALQSLLDEFNK